QIHVLRPGRTRGLLTRLNHGDQWLDVRHELNCRNLSWVYTGKSRHDDHVTHLQIINRNDWQPLEHVSHVRSLRSRSLSARALRSRTLCSSSLRAWTFSARSLCSRTLSPWTLRPRTAALAGRSGPTTAWAAGSSTHHRHKSSQHRISLESNGERFLGLQIGNADFVCCHIDRSYGSAGDAKSPEHN